MLNKLKRERSCFTVFGLWLSEMCNLRRDLKDFKGDINASRLNLWRDGDDRNSWPGLEAGVPGAESTLSICNTDCILFESISLSADVNTS